MSLLDGIRSFLSLPALRDDVEVRTAAEPGSLIDFVSRYTQTANASAWRLASVKEALAVPAVFGIVSTIANTIGTLTLDAYRKGARLPPDDRPRLIVRPDPFRRPGSFWRDSAWNLATRGEAWWWIAKRDLDGSAMSIINAAPHEIVVEENTRDLRFPIIRWRGKKMPNEDMRQITYTREPGALRGQGPLQMCGAAVSVAVESQEWAANFYAEGGKGGTIIKSAHELGVMDGTWTPEGYEHEAEALRAAWVAKGNNLVRDIDPNIESVEEHEPNEAGAQMLTSRDFQIGEVARMFSYPMSLVGYAVNGSSITYANLGDRFDELTRLCLIPHYLEKFEQEMSDLLTRSTTCEFNVDRLRRADIKTRYEVHGLALDKGIYDADYARRLEGIAAGDIEQAPVPPSPPQAIPTAASVEGRTAVTELRCDGMVTKRRHGISQVERCNALLSQDGRFVGRCRRCKKVYDEAAA
jgi:HK97 family phage portal protein